MRIFTCARCVYAMCVCVSQTAVKFTIFIDFALLYEPAGDKLHIPCYSSSIPVVGLIVTARLMPPNKFRALFQVSRLRPFSRGETIYQSPRCLWQPNRRRSSSSRLNECLCECMSVLASLMSRLRLNKFDFHLHRKSQLANGASNTEKAP